MTEPHELGEEQPFITHLIELRNRLLKIILCVMLVFIATASYANEIYQYLADPLLKHMPQNSTMIAIDVASPFFTPFKLAFVVAVFVSVPFILFQEMVDEIVAFTFEETFKMIKRNLES